MIQRKQSLFLAGIFIISAYMVLADTRFFSGSFRSSEGQAYTFSVRAGQTELSSDGTEVLPGVNVRYALAATGLIALAGLFLFRRRELQIRFCAFNFLFMLLGFFYVAYGYYRISVMEDIQDLSIRPDASLVLLLLLPVFNFFALRGIRKDIELLASADRLR